MHREKKGGGRNKKKKRQVVSEFSSGVVWGFERGGKGAIDNNLAQLFAE